MVTTNTKNKDGIFELKFTGGTIIPENISAGELAEVLEAFENSLITTILKDHNELEAKNIIVSLVDVNTGSLKLSFKPKLKEVVFSALLLISNSIQNNTYGNLPIKTIESLQIINKFCKEKKCVAELRDNPYSTEPLARISSESKIEVPQTAYLFGETVIYGKVVRVGGVDPKVVLEVGKHQTLYCPISESQAKEIAKNLYSEVGCKGTAKWYIADYSIVDFKIDEIIYLDKTSFSQSINELSGLIGKYWKDVDDVIGEISKIRSSAA